MAYYSFTVQLSPIHRSFLYSNSKINLLTPFDRWSIFLVLSPTTVWICWRSLSNPSQETSPIHPPNTSSARKTWHMVHRILYYNTWNILRHFASLQYQCKDKGTKTSCQRCIYFRYIFVHMMYIISINGIVVDKCITILCSLRWVTKTILPGTLLVSHYPKIIQVLPFRIKTIKEN